MKESLRIAVADDEADMRIFFEEILRHMGHDVLPACKTGRELVALCLKEKPQLVITDIKMPEMDGIDAAKQIYEAHPLPVILVSAHHETELIRRAECDYVMAYLVKPIKQTDLEPAIALAAHRFDQFQSLRREAADLRQALEDRKIIERAKGILMRQAHLDEPDAFRRLQKLASEKNRKLIDVAHIILLAEEAFQPSH